MSFEELRYVVCYDIPDDRRRNRVAKLLDGYGDRVQYSVYEAVLDRALLDNLIDSLRKEMDPDKDRLILYGLCAACAKRRLAMGLGAEEPPPGQETVFIV